MPPNASRMIVVGVSPTLSGVLSLHQTMETMLVSLVLALKCHTMECGLDLVDMEAW